MKKLIILCLVFVLSIGMLTLSSFRISAATTNELIIEDSNANSIDDEGEASVTSSGEGLGHPDNHGEKWYILDTYNPTFGDQEVEIDYNQMPELLKYLKPGDIIYETNDSIVGDFTGHIAIVYDILWDETHQQYYVSIIEAYTGGVGYSIMTPNRFEEKEVIIYRIKNASETQIQGALTWIQGQLGKEFDMEITTKSNDPNEPDWYCAELVWAGFSHQEIYLDWDDNENCGSLISPHALALNSQLTTILHYDEETTVDNVDNTYHTISCDGDTYTEAHEFEAYNYCYEKCRICDYERQIRTHDYTYRYSNTASSGHYAYCICGARTTAPHNYEEYLPCSTKCAQCGHENEIGEHDYTYRYEVDTDNTDVHYGYCECGKKSTVAEEHSWIQGTLADTCELCGINKDHVHSYTYTSCKDGKTHKVSCGCGYVQYQQCFGMTETGSLTRCAKCKQVLSGNLIFPLEDDDDQNDVMIFKEDGLEEETE